MNSTHSDLKAFSQVGPTKILKQGSGLSVDTEYWTTEKLIDELILCLSSSKSCTIDEKTGHIQITHKYYEQAQFLCYRIPVWKPTPLFVIDLHDLRPKVTQELEKLQKSNPQALQYVLKMAVSAVFENIDPKYCHLSVACNLKIKFR